MHMRRASGVPTFALRSSVACAIASIYESAKRMTWDCSMVMVMASPCLPAGKSSDLISADAGFVLYKLAQPATINNPLTRAARAVSGSKNSRSKDGNAVLDFRQTSSLFMFGFSDGLGL
jgi:hypothetical protein